MNRDDLKKMIRDIPDFPKKGIIFKDITTVLKDYKALRQCLILCWKILRMKK